MYFIGSAQLADAPSRTANQAMEKLGLISIPPEFSRETHKVADKIYDSLKYGK
jgi:hypothetical protein